MFTYALKIIPGGTKLQKWKVSLLFHQNMKLWLLRIFYGPYGTMMWVDDKKDFFSCLCFLSLDFSSQSFVPFIPGSSTEETFHFPSRWHNEENKEKKKRIRKFHALFMSCIHDTVCFITHQQSFGNTRFCSMLPLSFRRGRLSKCFTQLNYRKGTRFLFGKLHLS